MVGEDAVGVEVGEALEIDEVGVEADRLGDEGDGVLHRVAGEQHALFGHPHHGGVVAVDVDVDDLEAKAAHVEAHAVVEGRVGRTSGSIPGGPPSVPASILRLLAVSRSAVRAVAITSQSAKAAVPAM